MDGPQAKASKPFFDMSSKDRGSFNSCIVDNVHPVTPEYQISIDGYHKDYAHLPQILAQRQLVLPTDAKSKMCFMASSMVCLPMMPSDEELSVPTPSSLFFLPVTRECSRSNMTP
jgi:hypothetical protein